jgi:hypothetical protein
MDDEIKFALKISAKVIGTKIVQDLMIIAMIQAILFS